MLGSVEAMRSVCSRIIDTIDSGGDAGALQGYLSDLIALQAASSSGDLPGPAHDDDAMSSGPSNAKQREAVLHQLTLHLDSLAQTLCVSIDKTGALLEASCSFITPLGPMGDGAAHGGPMLPPLPPVEAILEYAHRLRYTTFAHAGLVSQPPAPQQAQMLNSTLFR